MWYLKYDTNELICEAETDSQTQRTDLWLPKGKGEGDKLKFGINIHTHTHTHTHTLLYIKQTTNKERELYPICSNHLGVVCQLLSCVQFFVIPWTVAHQDPLSMELSRQEYWSGQPFPSPGDLPNPGIEPGSPIQQAGRFFTI